MRFFAFIGLLGVCLIYPPIGFILLALFFLGLIVDG